MNHKEHISKKFDADLEDVRTRVLQMGGLVEEQIERAVEALTEGNEHMIEQVIDNDHRVNAMEVKIDELCCQIIARRQPAAGDLRMIMTVINTITDLERMGDEAAKIARMAKLIYSADRMYVPRFVEIKHIANIAINMLHKALDAFARLDPNASAEIVRQDEQVDEEFRSIIRQLITFMMEDPRKISTAIEILFAAKAIERIGDHAKNMSEYVVYMVKGKDVRHVTADELEHEIRK
ncbi:phosphate signaling complex protein PhoU [Nitrosomonas halophila]|jgi:phosphate transport system protein|uniref:Phosphate-specific transport system accessory protein PhoU n=1 Tax=Nitrosomonas halophila TaxID=44576 RepID=A0A1H3HVR7_9PROT|nr:phosphate signaling complex protein PhoU [Nitrosomonas halophila]SDY19611.1 phosphate transport system protein [Nitrosomonas halophila]